MCTSLTEDCFLLRSVKERKSSLKTRRKDKENTKRTASGKPETLEGVLRKRKEEWKE